MLRISFFSFLSLFYPLFYLLFYPCDWTFHEMSYSMVTGGKMKIHSIFLLVLLGGLLPATKARADLFGITFYDGTSTTVDADARIK